MTITVPPPPVTLPTPVIKAIECASAEDFVDQMSPMRGSLWGRREWGDERDWIFRGVSRADRAWAFQPSAFRKDAFCRYLPGQAQLMIETAKEQRGYENFLVAQFCSKADSMGFTVPGDSPVLRDSRYAREATSPQEFPAVEDLHMHALAQHYRIPTRLLDWTTRPLVAAYFAVQEVAKIRANLISKEIVDGQRCAVWALDRSFVVEVTEKHFDPTIRIVTAPKATNPNLAAQGGLFTLVQPVTDDPHPIPNLDTVLEKNFSAIPDEWRDRLPVLYQFTLPVAEARVALRLLHSEGIHAGSIMPGLAGVAAEMRECWAHQRGPKGQRY